MVEDIEHRALLVDAYLQSRIERDVADENTESDGHQQQRFKFILDAQEDEHQADNNHPEMVHGEVGEAGVFQKLDQLRGHKLHEATCC